MSAIFRELHRSGTFVAPNPWDVGSAVLLEELGFPGLATTSSGLAATMGRADQTVTRDELLAHVATMCARATVPVSVDAEECYPSARGGVAETVRLLAAAGAAGCSIEDWDPASRSLRSIEAATEAVAVAADAASGSDIVLTARAENHIRGVDDLDDTIGRLLAYRDAGAEVLYAPGLVELHQIRRVVEEVGAPVNALILPDGPTVDELASVGVRRISTGGGLARLAQRSLGDAARKLLAGGTPYG